MNIVLDLGNTRLKAGVLTRGAATGSVQLCHPMATAYEQLHRFEDWLAQLPGPPTKIWGISVASQAKQEQVIAALADAPTTIQWLDAQQPHPQVHNAYAQPAHLGPDRWFGLLGAFERYPPTPDQALLYCSFGTATTIDLLLGRQKGIHYLHARAPQKPLPLISKPWLFIGGLILPGPYLMYQSLTRHTARLNFGLGAYADFPGQSSSAISSGIITAQLGAVVQQCLRAQALCPEQPVRLVCTGGGWPLVKKALQSQLTQWPDTYCSPPPELQFMKHAVLQGLGSLCPAAD